MPYRRLKKLHRDKAIKPDEWTALVQGVIRDLRPPYRHPRTLRLVLGDSCDRIAAVTHYKWDRKLKSETLEARVIVVGVDIGCQRQGLGHAALQEAVAACGYEARRTQARRLEISALVHSENSASAAMLRSAGWTEIGPDRDQPVCNTWVLAGERG